MRLRESGSLFLTLARMYFWYVLSPTYIVLWCASGTYLHRALEEDCSQTNIHPISAHPSYVFWPSRVFVSFYF